MNSTKDKPDFLKGQAFTWTQWIIKALQGKITKTAQLSLIMNKSESSSSFSQHLSPTWKARCKHNNTMGWFMTRKPDDVCTVITTHMYGCCVVWIGLCVCSWLCISLWICESTWDGSQSVPRPFWQTWFSAVMPPNPKLLIKLSRWAANMLTTRWDRSRDHTNDIITHVNNSTGFSDTPFSLCCHYKAKKRQQGKSIFLHLHLVSSLLLKREFINQGQIILRLTEEKWRQKRGEMEMRR